MNILITASFQLIQSEENAIIMVILTQYAKLTQLMNESTIFFLFVPGKYCAKHSFKEKITLFTSILWLPTGRIGIEPFSLLLKGNLSHFGHHIPLTLFFWQGGEGMETVLNLIRYSAFSFLYLLIGGKILYFSNFAG